MSGVLVNTGSLLALQKLGFDPLGWPIWAATELSILWNYNLNRHITWRERNYGRWWLYNIAAACSSLTAIGVTSTLVRWEQSPLGLASVGGIAVGMVMNFLVFDKIVFNSLTRLPTWLTPRVKPSTAAKPLTTNDPGLSDL